MQHSRNTSYGNGTLAPKMRRNGLNIAGQPSKKYWKPNGFRRIFRRKHPFQLAKYQRFTFILLPFLGQIKALRIEYF